MAVIPHQGCILLDHVQHYKTFSEKLRIPKSIEDLFISISHIASWRENFTSSSRWQEGENSDELCVRKYHEKMSGQTQYSVKVEARGPTSDAAHQHEHWIYHQIQEWRGDYALDPLKCGSQLTKRGIIPIEMTKQVTPPKLLKIVKYSCKIDWARKNCTWSCLY